MTECQYVVADLLLSGSTTRAHPLYRVSYMRHIVVPESEVLAQQLVMLNYHSLCAYSLFRVPRGYYQEAGKLH